MRDSLFKNRLSMSLSIWTSYPRGAAGVACPTRCIPPHPQVSPPRLPEAEVPQMVHAICHIRAERCCNRAQIIWLRGRRTHRGQVGAGEAEAFGAVRTIGALLIFMGVVVSATAGLMSAPSTIP